MSADIATIGVAVVANILSVVGVVLTNKYIVESDGNIYCFVMCVNCFYCDACILS